MAITAKDVMDLRNKTGLGMMECKAALAETDGDVAKAVDLLRAKGIAKMDGRADRASAEGRVGTAVAGDKGKGSIVEINTETDFTAGSDVFKAMVQAVANEALKQPVGDVQATDAIKTLIDNVRITTKENIQFARGRVLGSGGSKIGSYVHHNGKVGVLVEVKGDSTPELLTDLCMHVTAVQPTPVAIDEAGVPAELIAKEKEIAKAQAIEQGKPEAIAEKMVVGKIRKFLEENSLINQVFVKDDKKKVKEILPKGSTVAAFVRYGVGSK
ncbi:MAG: translation elongation factor Ts [Planctomycetota bacterium]|nr:translation elongation factor Ts [Planctomycetota bacterium]